MTQMPPQCKNLQEQVDSLLQLLRQEPSLRQQDITAVQASLKKAISPEFEIVFAGAFSAGKSMLINALLERELLYSAVGHATGTECYIAYAESTQKERVVLTFSSEVEIRQQAYALCEQLNLTTEIDINLTDVVKILAQGCSIIIEKEGGENKSERAKQAKALTLLLEGFEANRDRIQAVENATYSMEQFNFSNLKEAASYARRGSNSAVLKRVEYYCYHPLLQDGNIIIDTPGIDAPVKQDAELTYDKIESPDTSAVVCVLKAASSGEMTTEETELMEKTRSNPGIRDRLFYIFNRIDETWYNAQLIQRLENLINSDFRDTARVYKTSGLLGFYGSLIKGTTGRDRFGLDSIFVESRDRVDADTNADSKSENTEETPLFVSEFNRYCANSGKLSPSKFRISVNSYETPSQNYVRILAEQGQPLIQQLIQDSGIEDFRTAITDYLTKEKRPQLFRNLADDLEDLCIQLRKQYQTIQRNLDSQPREIEAMKAQELLRLNQELQQVGQEFREHIAKEVNDMIMNRCDIFDTDFRQLQSRMIRRLDELLDGFSVEAAYGRTLMTHPRNATAPLIAVLVEALYYLANQLEDILVEATKSLVENYFQYLKDSIRKSEYYRLLYRLLGNDGGIEQQLEELSQRVSRALVNAAGVECDRYVRESPRFYDEGTFSIYQFRETLQQTSQGFDCENMVDAQPAIRQLLRLDFEPKVSKTIRQTFRQTVNQTLKEHLLPMAEQQADDILQKYSQARDYLEQTLAQEAEEKIAKNLRLQAENEEKIQEYDRAVSGINSCLQAMKLHEHLLPVIGENNSVVVDCE
ncbi:MAG: dynamin family protein [Microcoleus sp. PH2017_29_MFU_D_A]|uniref:dynamin family protein n=2 Tax=unclassified Microcoleus TaxID=2642155 RepID=UPI001D5F85BC|nr:MULTISPECIES: dynamin family protein [unclassified Microcoleus]MCC3433303.1 dynamin family protein [Microcoleus sp. PH2017_04_SCI_O_A]TAE56504.1 MAG: dynamin family protein [Oscillatoriales cyanobacterium]MCC3414094.1 dynamin family protein [Microcoleus sp. PH2017_02_FOX_O_A]MCC3423236.1 dynamin family protein [Microcoleus sp. PH2017_01_SCD_O_A]MCC3455721.1 dynamin family protein [Microcoleus sp. PH2017_08_TRC_O_A]